MSYPSIVAKRSRCSWLFFLLSCSSWASLGMFLAMLTLVFKTPVLVKEMPLSQEKGYVYWEEQSTKPSEWGVKRKAFFTQEGISIVLSSGDLNHWSKAFLKYSPPHIQPLNYNFKSFKISSLKNSFSFRPETAPEFFIEKKGIYASQKLMFRIGKDIRIPIFFQCILVPTASKSLQTWDLKDCSIGFLSAKSLGLSDDFVKLMVYQYLAENQELKHIQSALKNIDDIELGPDRLVLKKKLTDAR